MVAEAWIEELQGIVGKKNVTQNAPMSRYTTLRLGGPAELLCEITSEDALSRTLAWASRHDFSLTVIGNGSNLLVKDGGIRGLVVHIGDGFSRISGPVPLPDGRFALTAQGGALLSSLANAAASHGLAGLEFSAGIPGTVGGAVYMNAGAYGGEMKDVVTSVTAYDFTGKPLAFWRRICISDIARAVFRRRSLRGGDRYRHTVPGEEDAIWAAMREFNSRRKEAALAAAQLRKYLQEAARPVHRTPD